MLTKETTPPSRVSNEGGVGGGVSTEETPPPSRVSSEGGVNFEGCVDKRNTPSVSHFERGREWRGWMQQHDEERDVSLRRVGSVEVSKLN